MTGLCLILTVIYEFNGHGVYSWRIRLLALIPFVMFLFLLLLKNRNFVPFIEAITFMRLFAAAEIARNAFIGIVRVYGTATVTMYVLYAVSAFFLAATLISFAVCLIRYLRNRGAEA